MLASFTVTFSPYDVPSACCVVLCPCLFLEMDLCFAVSFFIGRGLERTCLEGANSPVGFRADLMCFVCSFFFLTSFHTGCDCVCEAWRSISFDTRCRSRVDVTLDTIMGTTYFSSLALFRRITSLYLNAPLQQIDSKRREIEAARGRYKYLMTVASLQKY